MSLIYTVSKLGVIFFGTPCISMVCLSQIWFGLRRVIGAGQTHICDSQTSDTRRQIFKYDTVIPILKQITFLNRKNKENYRKSSKNFDFFSIHVSRMT